MHAARRHAYLFALFVWLPIRLPARLTACVTIACVRITCVRHAQSACMDAYLPVRLRDNCLRDNCLRDDCLREDYLRDDYLRDVFRRDVYHRAAWLLPLAEPWHARRNASFTSFVAQREARRG